MATHPLTISKPQTHKIKMRNKFNVLLVLFAIAFSAQAQETIMFKGQPFLKYPYPLEIRNHFYSFNMDNPENGDGYDIPPYPFALKDGDYLVYFVVTESDSAENVAPRIGAKFSIKNGKQEGNCSFYHYRRIKNSDSLVVEMKGQYLNGEKQGVWTNYEYSEYGLLISTTTYNYKNGLFEGLYTNKDYRNKTITGNLVNNKKEGRWNYPGYLYNYKDGSKQGLQIDTCGALIVKYECEKNELSGDISLYNRYTGNLEFKFENIVEKSEMPFMSNRFYQCFDADPVLEYAVFNCDPLRSLQSNRDFDLTIYHNNVANKTITYYSEGFSKQNSGYIKEYDYLDIKNNPQKFVLEVKYQKSENNFVNEVRSVYFNKELVDVVGFDIDNEKASIYQHVYEENRNKQQPLLDVLLNIDRNVNYGYEYGRALPVNDYSESSIKEKHEYSLTYLERKFGKLFNGILTDSILYVDTAKILMVKKRYYFGENQVQQVAEIFPKKGKPYLYNGAVITKQKGKATALQITKNLYKSKNPRIETINKFKLSYQDVVVESDYSLKLKNGEKVNPNGVYISYSSILENGNEEYPLFEFKPKDDVLLYVDGKPFTGSLWMYDSLINGVKDSVLYKKGKSISFQNNWIKIQHYKDTSNNYISDLYYEQYPVYNAKSATYISFVNGLKDGPFYVVTEKQKDSFFVNVFGKYAQGKWMGSQLTSYDFGSISYDRSAANCLVNYINGEKEGIQKFLDNKELVKLVHSKNLGNDRNRIQDQIAEIVKGTRFNNYNSIAKGAVSGNYLGTQDICAKFDFDQNNMGDTILLYHAFWNSSKPQLKERIVLDKFGNGFLEIYNGSKEEKTYLELKYLIKDHYLSDSFVEYFQDGRIGKVGNNVRNLNIKVEKKIVRNQWSVILKLNEQFPQTIFLASYDEKSGNYYVTNSRIEYMVKKAENALIDYVHYNKGGIRIAEGQELSGEKHGQWNYYNVEGKIYCRIFYEDDENGKQSFYAYDANGKQYCSGTSESINFDAECEALVEMPGIVPGIMSEVTQSKTTVKNGDKYVWLKMYRYNKNACCEGWYNLSKHEKDSVWKYYSYNGTLKEIGTYKNDLKEGRWIEGNLTGINYLDNRCFDASDSLFIQTQMRNLEFTQSLYQEGELIKEIRNNVNLNKAQQSTEGEIRYWFLPIENPKLLLNPEESYKFYYQGNPIEYMGC